MKYADSLFRYGRSDSPSTAAWARGNAWTSVTACSPRFNELNPEKTESKLASSIRRHRDAANHWIAYPNTPPLLRLHLASETLRAIWLVRNGRRLNSPFPAERALRGRAPHRPVRMAGQSPRQQAGLRRICSLRTSTTRATPKRTSRGTNTSGYAETAAKPTRVAGTTNNITAVEPCSRRSTLLAIRTRAANVAAAHAC